ncbi:unnamed protein product [Paramecium primaurelia]|uniref:Uncharacterized protein n=1 Tax=Paramecium primaurelia TaxID=5886 RepID=A0A8S1MRA1_PARPR|nr:unnamed protein product [Paramecium primaurelia]
MSLEILDYLKQENQQLQEQVRELQGLLQLNKQALKVLMPQTSDEQHKGLLTVLKNLQEENETLQLKIEKLVKERNEAQCDQLINQQITEEVQRQEKELIASLQQKMQGLQENLMFAESKLAKMEELKPEYDEVAGVVIKFREVCDPDLIGLKMHNEIQMLNEQLLNEQKQKQKLIKEKQSIQGLNLRLMNELLQQKSLAHAGNKMIFMNQDPEQLVDFQARALKLMNNSSSNDSPSSKSSEAPIDGNYSPKIQQFQMNSTKGTVIPKLDLTRAKQIQEINAKRQIQQTQKPLNDIQSMERIQKLEKALDELRRNHQREMILNKTLQAHNDELQRYCNEMEHRIKILTNSNIRYQEKAKKMNANYRFLHQFYLNHKDLLPTTSLSSSHQRQTSANQIEDEQSQSKQFDIDEMESPILKQNNEPLIQQQQLASTVYYFIPNNKDESIKYLLQTAQQIYSTIYERVDRVIQEEPQCKHRFRSFSEIIIN